MGFPPCPHSFSLGEEKDHRGEIKELDKIKYSQNGHNVFLSTESQVFSF